MYEYIPQYMYSFVNICIDKQKIIHKNVTMCQ